MVGEISIDERFARACQLESEGNPDAAQRAYVELLHAEATHFPTLMRLGALLATRRQAHAARTVFAQAVAAHPEEPAGHAALASLLVDAGENEAATRAFERALELDPGNRDAHRGLAVLAERAGDQLTAQRHWRAGFPDGRLATTPVRGPGPHPRVLVVASALGGNISLGHVLDPSRFALTTLIAESFSPRTHFGTYDTVFNTIGDADRARRGLDFAERALAGTRTRIINPPQRVRHTTRAENAIRLSALGGVIAPATIPFPRGTDAAALGLRFPFLVRSPGYQTGLHFLRVDDAAEFAEAVRTLPGEELLAIAFADTRDSDGAYVKYRAMAIDRVIYPVHRATSSHWKIHAFSAQREEPEPVLDAATLARLASIVELLDLDYCGIDFGYDQAGRLVVFEANATMIARDPPVIEAVQRMLGTQRTA
ncbi:MAG: tetratricopeptide repeat protein [Candidatus Velthaea sp.]|jgi:glutathione synthase/RimK-type ligase-like ATP-grasp enzyme